MLRFGSDKPDLRFGLEIQDATEITRGSEFGVFANAQAVRYLTRAAGALPRRGPRSSRTWRSRGAPRVSRTSSSGEDGEVASPIAKFLSEEELDVVSASRARRCSSWRTRRRLPPRCSACCACTSAASSSSSTEAWEFLWITPTAAARVERGGGPAGPRSTIRSRARPTTVCGSSTIDPGRASAVAYDLVGNGIELARRLDSNPRARAAGADVRASSASRRRSSARSSDSSSTRSRWARRRTVASPRGSTG